MMEKIKSFFTDLMGNGEEKEGRTAVGDDGGDDV